LPHTSVNVSASDVDGDSLTYAGSKVSGPGTVTFGNAAAASTTATFGSAGSYSLQVTNALGSVAVSNLNVSFDGLWLGAEPSADPAQFISFFVAVVMMYDPLKKLGGVADQIATGSAAMDRIFEVADLAPDIVDAKGAHVLPPFRLTTRLTCCESWPRTSVPSRIRST